MRNKMRATKRSLRVTNSRHNDLNFDLSNAKQHDPSRVSENVYFTCYDSEGFEGTFDDAEARFYEEHFRESLDARNAVHEARRQYARVKTMDEFRTNKNFCPEEYVLQIGNASEARAGAVDADALMECVNDYLDWELEWSRTHGNPFTIVDGAIHASEASPHAHIRRVWTYEDDNGLLQVGQDKALEKAGVGLPDPSKKRSRHNNRKMVFDKECREAWLDILEKHGFDIEREPLPDQHHVPNGAYQAEQAERAEDLRKQNDALSAQNARLSRQNDKLEDSLRQTEKALETALEAVREANAEHKALRMENDALTAENERLKVHIEAKKIGLGRMERVERTVEQTKSIQENADSKRKSRRLPGIDFG